LPTNQIDRATRKALTSLIRPVLSATPSNSNSNRNKQQATATQQQQPQQATSNSYPATATSPLNVHQPDGHFKHGIFVEREDFGR
jgi:hypothetical protein